MGQFSGTHISQTAEPISFKFDMYRVAYMEGIKYMNLIEIGPVVIEIQGIENGELVVPVNNTLECHMAFLAADTRLPVCLDYLILNYNRFIITQDLITLYLIT